MPTVYALGRLLVLLLSESSRHVGAAATSAALRDSLDREGLVRTDQFDRSFAASRLTPGTNLIALFAALGGIVAGPLGAVAAVVVGLLPAVLISLVVCGIYLAVDDSPMVQRAIGGASAAAWAVLVWSAGRFLLPPARSHPVATVVLTLTTISLGLMGVPVLLLLVLSAVAGALSFRASA